MDSKYSVNAIGRWILDMGLPFLSLTSTTPDRGVCIQCFIDRCNVDVMTRVDLNQNHPATARERQCDCDDARLVPTLDTSQLMSQSFTPLTHSCSSSFVVYRTLVAVAEVKWGLAGVTRISVAVQVWNVDADAIAAPGLMLWCSRQSSPEGRRYSGDIVSWIRRHPGDIPP